MRDPHAEHSLLLLTRSLKVIRSALNIMGRWTWECGEKKSVVDYIRVSREVNAHMMVANLEDKEVVELGSDHN